MLIIEELPTREDKPGRIEHIFMTSRERLFPRRKYLTDQGTEVAIALPRGTALIEGCLVYNDGNVAIVVVAKEEDVIVITSKDERKRARFCHQLGNWHRSLQLNASGDLIAEASEDLVAWLDELGLEYRKDLLPFEPNLRATSH